MSKAQEFLVIVEKSQSKKCTCPKCGHSFDEDNSPAVLKGAKIYPLPTDPPESDQDDSGHYSSDAFPTGHMSGSLSHRMIGRRI